MTTEPRPAAPAGWYEWGEMKDTVRYWTGSGWSDHYGPAPTTGPAPAIPSPPSKAQRQNYSSGRPCTYCGEEVGAQATRCPHCSGEFMHCSRCKALRAVNTRQKFVGVLRGGRTEVHDCRECGKQLTGPRM